MEFEVVSGTHGLKVQLVRYYLFFIKSVRYQQTKSYVSYYFSRFLDY